MADRVAIAGVGYTPFSKASGRPVLDLATEAAVAACGDAGLPLHEVDGIASYMVGADSENAQAVAPHWPCPGCGSSLDLNQAGQAPCHLRGARRRCRRRRARAVRPDLPSAQRPFRTEVGSARFPGRGGQFRYPIGYDAYLMYVAMWARRFLYETGQDARRPRRGGHRPPPVRRYATERAVRRAPLDLDAYLASPLVADPFRVADCTTEVDGACALLVTTLDRARDLRRPPVRGGRGRVPSRPATGAGHRRPRSHHDYTRNFTDLVRDDLFGRAGITPADVDVAEIYDCFTSTVLMGLEGLGFCGRGGAGELVRLRAPPDQHARRPARRRATCTA